MAPIVLSFVSSHMANRMVVGVPAIARLARSWQRAQQALGGAEPMRVFWPDDGGLDARSRSEIDRLAPGLALIVETAGQPRGQILAAEQLPDEAIIAQWLNGGAEMDYPSFPLDDEQSARRALDVAGMRIIKATGKPGDGIVSRWLNRPLSQAATRQLLRISTIRPGHATALTAIIALVMFAALVTGGTSGLIAGALLFQLASIADGIDGEIARATFRSSESGAMWDSAIDAATNLGFILGVIINCWQQGWMAAAQLGLAGLLILATGMAVLGAHSRARGQALNFDGAKQAFAASSAGWKRWLRYLTMRDFYCLFFAVMIVAGWVLPALAMFSVAAAIWLAVVVIVLGRKDA